MRHGASLVLVAALGVVTPSAADEFYVVPDGARVRGDGPDPNASAERGVELDALRGETVAFQIVSPRAARPREPVVPGPLVVRTQDATLTGTIWMEHFVDVRRRSHNDRAPGALAFTREASPSDDVGLGLLPDALLTVDQAARLRAIDDAAPGAARAPARDVLYAEIFVPESAPPGAYAGAVELTVSGRPIARVPVTLTVAPAVLPYRAVRAHAYYERDTLERYFVDPDRAERDLVRVLHAHQLDALVQITEPAHVERVMGALDGTWFESDYAGPGRGVPASVVALGAYGTLGDPTPAALERVIALESRVPSAVDDVFVYAIDETCDSPRGPAWRAALHEAGLYPRVLAGHTCHVDPTEHDVDLAMVPAQAFDPESADRARSAGKRVWIYNGMLPFSGAMVLDVPPTSLVDNGWVAATFDVGRWFYWESVFWEDHNRGGRGPRDVFIDPETFHNADGDTALYDGLLVYPGRMPTSVGTHDLGFDGVVPSLRLKALRRGIEDAALIGLAAQVDAAATDAIVRSVVAGALDEVGPHERPRLELDARVLAARRAELRRIIGSAPIPPGATVADVGRGLASVRRLRQARREETRSGLGPARSRVLWIRMGLPATLFSFGLAVACGLAARRRRRS